MATDLQLLIVEDSEDDALLLLRELQKGGYEPAWERVDTPEAMKAALTTRNWDVVVSDYSMPSFSGLAALRMVRESDPDLPFIIVSGTIGEETAVEAMRSGAHDYIIKGNLARLAPAIDRELNESVVRHKRRQAEIALALAEMEWERTFDSIIDPIMILDNGFKIVKANKAMAGALGVTPVEMMGLTCCNIVHGLEKPPPVCPHALLLADGCPHAVEIFEARLGGNFEIVVSPLRDAEGAVYGSVHYARDINARKQAEQKTIRLKHLYTVLSRFNEAIVRIRESERLFRELCRIIVEVGLFRMAWVGIVDWETCTVEPVVHAGHEAGYLECIHISLDPELPEGRGPTGTALRERRVLVNNDTAHNPCMSPWRKEALERGYLASATFPIHSGDTLYGAFTMYAGEANYFDTDEIALLSSLSDDLSYAVDAMRIEAERKQAEATLVKEKEFLRNLLQGSAIATFVLDPQHRVLLWNLACEKLTGISSADVVGTTLHWRAFYHRERPCLADLVMEGCTEQLQEAYAHVSPSTLTPEGLQAEGRYPELNGMDRFIIFNAAPIRDSSGALLGAVETIQDITEQKTLEAQLFQAQKMEAIGQLAGGIAHDFNNILTAIIGFSTLVEMNMDQEDPQKAIMSNVLAAAERATDLTRSLLTFSRKQDMNPQPVDLNQLISKIEQFLKRIIGEDVALRTTFSQDILIVNADSGQLEQVLMNLAANARDAMPGGGQLSIETGMVEIDDDFIAAHGYGDSGGYAVISVSDTGEGMDEATCKKVFEPFFTTKEAGKGTGLGLSIVFGIIKQHNGFISLSSEPGKGTTFRVLLPLIKEAVAEVQGAEQVVLEKGEETILVADDDAVLRDLTEKMLGMFGYTVITAVDGRDAVARFREHEDRIDLVILDVIMPEMNGKDAFEEMKRINPSLKAIFMSGYASEIIQKRGLLSADLDYVSKPLDLKQMMIKIRTVLGAPAAQ